MAEWRHRLEIKKGELIIIDDPEDRQIIPLGPAPKDAVIYIFENMEIAKHWVEKKKRVPPGMSSPQADGSKGR